MLKRTPLFPVYAEWGARLVDFGGWELPVQFSGIQTEHDAVRTDAGLFDVSHMGEFLVRGSGALDFLQKLTTNDASRLVPGQAQYTLMCYPDGGVVDDLLVYRLGDDEYMTVVNASNIGKDWEWMKRHETGDVELEDISEKTALLALQGPKSAGILASLTDAPVESLKPFHFVRKAMVAGVEALLSRTGYTGEDGFELYAAAEDAITLWKALLDAGRPEGLVPVGLGARDTLRFEAKLPLYGQELGPDITPLEAGLGIFVKLGKGDFNGREALQSQKDSGVPRKLAGIEMIDRGIPRSHYPIYSEAGIKIGEVTTGTQSPTLKRNVGLALLDSSFVQTGTEVYVEIRGKKLKARVVPAPFYKRTGKEQTVQ